MRSFNVEVLRYIYLFIYILGMKYTNSLSLELAQLSWENLFGSDKYGLEVARAFETKGTISAARLRL